MPSGPWALETFRPVSNFLTSDSQQDKDEIIWSVYGWSSSRNWSGTPGLHVNTDVKNLCYVKAIWSFLVFKRHFRWNRSWLGLDFINVQKRLGLSLFIRDWIWYQWLLLSSDLTLFLHCLYLSLSDCSRGFQHFSSIWKQFWRHLSHNKTSV